MTTPTPTPTKLQNPIQPRPMATTIAQADLVIRTVAGFTGSGDSNEILHNILITPHEDHVVVAATDSYRMASAKVSRDLWIGIGLEQRLVSVKDLDGAAWVKAIEIATALGGRAYPDIIRFLHPTIKPTFAASLAPLHGDGYPSNRDFNSTNLIKWAYWDGERRRPTGLVELLHTSLKVSYRLGLMLKNDARMLDATLWDGVTRPLADIVPAVPAAQGVGSDGDAQTLTAQTLGVYNSMYLPDWQHIDMIRYQGPRKPLYLAGGVFEFIVMPIMMSVYGEGVEE